METVDYAETWMKTWCPKCNEANWISQGDVTDLTGIDYDGVKCWNCETEYLFAGAEDYHSSVGQTIEENAMIGEGKKSPDD